MVDAQKFERLSILSQQLNEQCSTLNDTITEWNKRLLALNLGLEVWLNPFDYSGVYYAENDSDVRQKCVKEISLGYAKVDGQWQLAIKEEFLIAGNEEREQDVPIRVTRLLSCTREMRIKAMERFDSLLSHIEEEVTQRLQIVAKAQKLAEIDKP
jgi:hypothetical protein